MAGIAVVLVVCLLLLMSDRPGLVPWPSVGPTRECNFTQEYWRWHAAQRHNRSARFVWMEASAGLGNVMGAVAGLVSFAMRFGYVAIGAFGAGVAYSALPDLSLDMHCNASCWRELGGDRAVHASVLGHRWQPVTSASRLQIDALDHFSRLYEYGDTTYEYGDAAYAGRDAYMGRDEAWERYGCILHALFPVARRATADTTLHVRLGDVSFAVPNASKVYMVAGDTRTSEREMHAIFERVYRGVRGDVYLATDSALAERAFVTRFGARGHVGVGPIEHAMHLSGPAAAARLLRDFEEMVSAPCLVVGQSSLSCVASAWRGDVVYDARLRPMSGHNPYCLDLE